ncbi:HK97-gp10 family putative phage morphogenesis protein [Nonomuraea sp. NPDC049028]|uniref:HK97-gp10 family putative phage morphogenesis protein n=1 Tax=Nonomuraea sp. NPDC049028 TaxID=3364348 RepID=UPI003720347F
MGWDTSDLDKYISDLSRAGAKAEALTETVVRKIGLDTVAGAQAIAPVDTGNLKSSIGADFDGPGFEAGPTANYGGYVEYGTSRMSPQPYMRPAFDKATAPLDDMLGQVGKKALE